MDAVDEQNGTASGSEGLTTQKPIQPNQPSNQPPEKMLLAISLCVVYSLVGGLLWLFVLCVSLDVLVRLLLTKSRDCLKKNRNTLSSVF